MPESSELIFDVGWDTVLRLARERFVKMSEKEQNDAIGFDPEYPEYGDQVRQVLAGNVDPATLKDFDDFGFYETISVILRPLNEQLMEIHKRLIEKRFGKAYKGDIGANRPGGHAGVPRGLSASDWYTYTCAKTPEGPRAFNLFTIERYSDDGDYDVNWGIGLTSRYIPAWIDWHAQHGGSGAFRLNAEALEMIEEARTAIAEVLPEIKDAELVNAPNFY